MQQQQQQGRTDGRRRKGREGKWEGIVDIVSLEEDNGQINEYVSQWGIVEGGGVGSRKVV